MIFKSRNQLSPEVTIEFNGATVDYKSIHSVNIHLEENKHDVAVISITGIPAKAITDYIGNSVKIYASIGQGRTLEFCGYVLYIEPESISSTRLINNSVFQIAKVTCFGVSVSMKSTKTRVWNNISSTILATSIASEYGLSTEVLKDNFSIPRIVQTKQSDWEFITDFCKKYGYSVSVHGTHLRLWDSNKALGKSQSFEVLSAPSKFTELQPGTILKFQGTFGYLTPEGSAYTYTVESIDSNGRMVQTKGSPIDPANSFSGLSRQPTYRSELVASSNSVHESERIIESKLKSRLPFNAVIETVSALGTIPGGVVLMTGYDSKFEGFWYVRSIEHEIVGSVCSSKLKISKDFNTTNNEVFPPAELSQLPPQSKFVNNSWRAAIERVDIYV